ncbi:other/IRE protein kinase [Rhodotorula toruloides]|uniref:non-specific serine/threonine protein kinase n=1 Tax=Rhodotorula toruloides TaxID=5286 RepID=A0A511KJG6_RHOTO|nr:other/IRE protein kinase [Rhodotorula toruloides]
MPPTARRAPLSHLTSPFLALSSSLGPHTANAAPQPAALAPRPDQLQGGRDPASFPAHLMDRSKAQQQDRLPDAIRGVRFNAPLRPPPLPGRPVNEAAEEVEGFQLSQLVLAVTVDGQVHALKRETGQWVWTLHDDGGIALGRVGRGSAEERRRRSGAGNAVGEPLVKSVSRKKRASPTASSSRSTVLSNETSVIAIDTADEDDDETYIIEPSGSGDIYVYSRSSGGLDKLPLSMQELVALSPFRFPGDSSRMFSASKNTKFVGVDLKTGRLVGVLGSNAGWCEWDEGDELTAGARAVEQDCEEDIVKRPEDLLYMARTEYHLSIYDTSSSLPLQTLSYTTYTSSALPHVSTPASSGTYPSQSTWTRTPDSLYLQPMHDGSLVCFRAGQAGVQWSIDFEAPVVSVFDVVVPLSSPSAIEGSDPHPVMVEQPHPLLVPDLPLDFSVLQQEPAATFIGRVVSPVTGEEQLFAMSRDRFPLVPFAQVAEAAKAGLGEGEEGAEPVEEKPEPPCRGVDCIIGRHRLLHPPPASPLDATIDAPTEPLLIEAAPSLSLPSPSAPHDSLSTPNRRTPHLPGSSTLLARLSSSSVMRELSGHGEVLAGGRLTIGVMVLVLVGWWWSRWRKVGEEAKGEGEGKRRSGRRTKGRGKKQLQAGAVANGGDASVTAAPRGGPSQQNGLDFGGVRSETEVAVPSVAPPPSVEGLRKRSPSTPPTPTNLSFAPLSSSSSVSGSSTPARARASSLSLSPAFPLSSTLKELPPLPPSALIDSDPTEELLNASPSFSSSVELGDQADEGADSDSAPPSLAPGGAPGTPPRKRQRRRRGAKKKKPKEGQGMDEIAVRAVDEKDLFEGITLSERETRGEEADGSEEGVGGTSAQVDADGKGVDGDVAGASAQVSAAIGAGELDAVTKSARLDPQVVGGLAVSKEILGYGSHGTVVLRGEFQGRAVAVKRLLKDFVTIAAHEVNLLQESDDHPHVIRYFCKEQRETFLYIALELCPASLFDLVDQPSAFPDLVRQLDPKKALKQITSGLRHLHSLKIVHRDIKPQNILVSTAKRGQPGLRMLISDFGLCKKLDVDESSFQQTVNHAAGSFGYRAPEVLRGLVDPNEGATGTSSASAGSGGSSTTLAGLTTTDPSMRLTRSIDIFSLGCIFYYVLTRGDHPFGGRYEREMNILNGKASLDRLDGLGEEAVEVQDLILRMVATDPRERPTADAVLLHPFFWNAQKRLLFICDASDRFEIMERDPPTATLVSLENRAREIVGDDWQKALDRTFLENLGKYRKYDGASVRDLLRVLRNKKHHYQDLPESVQRALGDLPGGFLSYFTTRFPHLLLHVYDTVARHLADEPMFASTFRIPEDEA